MGLRCVCPNGHVLNVKADLAGRRGKCPKCGEPFEIPAASAAEPLGVGPAAADPTASMVVPTIPPPVAPSQQVAPSPPTIPPVVAAVPPPPTLEWRLASPDGQHFGPTVPAVFAQWIAEGRVKPDWLVWRSDWPEWRVAAEVAGELPGALALGASGTPPAPPPLAPPALATAPSMPAGPVKMSPTSEYNVRRMRAARRRRLVVVTLAIVAGALFGAFAWLTMR
jgi:hypothetical protein